MTSAEKKSQRSRTSRSNSNGSSRLKCDPKAEQLAQEKQKLINKREAINRELDEARMAPAELEEWHNKFQQTLTSTPKTLDDHAEFLTSILEP